MPTIRERNGRFQAQVRIKQQGVIVYEKTATFETKPQAKAWGYGVEEAFAKGTLADSPSLTTIATVVETHRQALVDADKDVRGLSNSFNHLIASRMGRIPILRATSGDIVEWAKEYSATRSPATVLHALMTLRTCYSTARSEMNIKADIQEVADAVKHLSRLGLAGKSIERERRVSDAEVDLICKYHEKLDGTTIPMRAAMNLAITLPRRRSELFSGMRWVDYTGESIKLWDTKDPTKIRNEVVPIPPKARLIIEQLPPTKSGYIMPHNPASVGTAIYRACQMVGIEDLHLHDLRHEGISRLFEEGLDIPRVAMISGHQSWSTLKRYTHLTAKDVVTRLTEFADAESARLSADQM
jgi:integrase